MPYEALLTFAVVALTVVLMAQEFLSPDYLLLGALLVLSVAGVLDVDGALAGFANPALPTIGGLFLVAAGIRATGIIDRVADAMFGSATSLRPVLARLTTLAAGGSAFMSNTAIVAIGIPTLDRWARERGISPSKLLIPLSYTSIVGGLLTLIGTSTNIVMDGLMRDHGMEALGFFELTVVGLPLSLVVIAYLTLVSPYTLPAREPPGRPFAEAKEYVSEMVLSAASPLVGGTVKRAGLLRVDDLYMVRIEREGRIVAPVEPGERLAAGDRLTFAGALERIVELRHLEGLRPVSAMGLPPADETWKLYQAVITPGSPIVGTKLSEAEFRARYSAVVIAVQRRGEEPRTSIGESITSRMPPMPGRSESRPYGMAVDDADRIWFVETGIQPNRFVGFDPENEEFFSRVEVESGGGTIRHMYFDAETNSVWFGTDANTVGRAVLPPARPVS